ncbi:MAG: FKBP-type peptidyl-prolyl cis-trans isomerase [Deltaproteobacteria bacterium]
MKIGLDSHVTIHYTLASSTGEMSMHEDGCRAVAFVYGRTPLFPALDRALLGLSEGETVEIHLPPEQAFGVHDPSLVNKISLEDLGDADTLRVGGYYEFRDPSGRPCGFTVREIADGYVLADFNHPNAGKAFTLTVTVSKVRPATSSEILAALNLTLSQGGG